MCNLVNSSNNNILNYSLKQINYIYICVCMPICTKQRTTSLFLFVNNIFVYFKKRLFGSYINENKIQVVNTVKQR